jgi:hypothetical protein
MFKWSLLLPVALIAVLALAGCGSDNESETSPTGQGTEAQTTGSTTQATTDATTTKHTGGSDEDQIRRVITLTITTSKPGNCTQLETLRFVEQTNFGEGGNAIAICHLAGPELAADSVAISKVKIEGDRATAQMAVTGSRFDGQVLVVSLVKKGGQWKMDHIDAFIDFDGDRFAEEFVIVHERAHDLRPGQVACVEESLKGVPPAQLEKLVLSGDPKALRKPFLHCIVKEKRPSNPG